MLILTKYTLLLGTLFIFVNSSCNDSDNSCTPKGQAFEIMAGQTYCITDEHLAEIVSIESSYCPCNATCIWVGEASVEVHVLDADNQQILDRIWIHEVKEIANDYGLYIHMIETDRACEPVIQSIQLIRR